MTLELADVNLRFQKTKLELLLKVVNKHKCSGKTSQLSARQTGIIPNFWDLFLI